MEERIIPSVNDNKDKQLTYQKMIDKYNRAIRDGFFCEAIMIAYAMIEDRLRSMIYHMGFLANRQTLSLYKRTRPFLETCAEGYLDPDEDSRLGVKTLAGKIKIVRCTYLWAENVEGGYETDKFAMVLKSQIEGTDIDAVLTTLSDIEKWKDCRNEIVHAMMNKNFISLEATMEPHAVEGMRMARALDTQEKLLKRGNRIRKRVNLPMN